MEPQRISEQAIAGFVTSFFCSLIGLVLCIMALNDIGTSGGKLGGRGLANAGIVVSCIGFLIAIVLVASRHG